MTTEELIVGAAILVFVVAGVWNTVVRVRIVRLFLRRLFRMDE
jgi:hypothetical protein